MNKLENIEENLNKMLKSSNMDSAFLTPVDYFSTLPSDIKKSIHTITALSQDHAVIEDNLFIVPVNYFDNLNNQISTRIAINKEKRITLPAVFKKSVFTPSLLSAAMVILGFFYFQRPQQIIINHPVYSAKELGNSKYIDALNENDLIDFLADQGLEKENNDLEQYLLDNNIEASQLEIIL